MPSSVFTAIWVARVQPPTSGRQEHLDARTPGLILRVSASGRKSWYVLYRVAGDPTKRRLLLGSYPALTLAEARAAAQRVILDAHAGIDQGDRRREEKAEKTVAWLCEEFLERHARPKKRSVRDDERRIEKAIVPAWGERKIGSLRRRDVIELLDHIAARAPVEANRTLALVRRIYSWAMSRDLAEANPCSDIEPPGAETKRDRVLTEDEIRAFWAWTDGRTEGARVLTEAMRDLFRLRLLTAQRGAEVAAMRWDQIDLEARTWLIPAAVAKSGREHLVPLSSMALEILRARPRKDGCPWVFPSRGKAGHVVTLGIALAALQKACGFDFWGHDLRRTASTYMASLGVRPHVRRRVLNHAGDSLDEIYDRFSYLPEKRDALDRWAARLGEIVGQ